MRLNNSINNSLRKFKTKTFLITVSLYVIKICPDSHNRFLIGCALPHVNVSHVNVSHVVLYHMYSASRRVLYGINTSTRILNIT